MYDILRTQLKEGQDFDDPSAIYFAESIVHSGIIFALVKPVIIDTRYI